jgi:hypothetical protein
MFIHFIEYAGVHYLRLDENSHSVYSTCVIREMHCSVVYAWFYSIHASPDKHLSVMYSFLVRALTAHVLQVKSCILPQELLTPTQHL